MNVISKKIDEIIPYWNNPRNNAETVDKLMRSIKEFGFNTPIVVNRDGVVITGHARLKACRKLGMKEVPCVVVDLTDEQAKKYRIADNKIAELSEWDEQQLYKELQEIGSAIDLEDIGFSDAEIQSVLGAMSAELERVDISTVTPVTAVVEPVQHSYEASTASPEITTQNIPENANHETAAPVVNEAQFVKEETDVNFAENLRKAQEKMETGIASNLEARNFKVTCPHCGEVFYIRDEKLR